VIHFLPCFGEWLLPAHFQPSLPFLCLFTDGWGLSLALFPTPFLWCSSAVHPPPPLSMFDYSLLFVIQFCWVGGINQPRGCTGLCTRGPMGESCVVCGAHLFVLSIDMQAGLEPAAMSLVAARNGTKFSQCSMMWGGFPWARVSGC
jgi:hypothetical protein